MEFSFKEFIESGLSPNAYIELYYLVHSEEIIDDNRRRLESTYQELQDKGYIKIQETDIIYRQKLLDLKAQINPEPQFDEFWKKYHEYAKKFNPMFRATDRDPAEKYWKKLTKSEKKLAMDNYKLFIDTTCASMSARYIKKARTYLSAKNYNDEFSYKEEKSSINKMI